MDIYGRSAERPVIASLVDGARSSRSGVLVLLGPAGVGKSTLLDEALGDGGDLCVLRARGVESEAEFAFAALHQLLRPVLPQVDRVPEHQSRALRVAIGMEEGPGGELFLVALAVLGVLAEAAEHSPVVCLVDDAQWLDHASADVLRFVARRLGAERIAMLFAARDDDAFDTAGLPQLRLAGLDADAAAALLDHRAPGRVDREVAQRLVAWSGGNPLALIELPALLTREQLAGAAPLPVPLPVPENVQRVFAVRAGRLPDHARTVLLVAAAEESARLTTVLAAAERLGIGRAALDAVEGAGLASVRQGEIVFSHPLARSAVYQAAPVRARHEAHLALAAVADATGEADRRAWHLAAAALEPDGPAVQELDAAANRARLRGGYAAAGAASERAAELTADAPARCRRLIQAADDAWLAGRFRQVTALLETARPLAGTSLLRADVGRLRGWTALSLGSPGAAHRILVEAARDAAPVDARRARAMLAAAAESAWLASDPATGAELARVAAGLASPGDDNDRLFADLLAGFLHHLDGDVATGTDLLARAVVNAERAGDPNLVAIAAHQAFYLGDDAAALRLSADAVARARAAGGVAELLFALPRLVQAQLLGGQWTAATAGAAEAARLAGEIGRAELSALPLAWLALIAALRGDDEGYRSCAGRVEALCAAHPLGVFRTPTAEITRWAGAMQAAVTGRPASAAALLDGLGHPVVTDLARLDRMEAAMSAGYREKARASLHELEEQAGRRAWPWTSARVAHGHALLSEGPVAAARFDEALAHHEQAGRPFERARTELAYGEALRRSKRRMDARPHLQAALDAFESLAAAPWAERAAAELRACGRTARRRDPSTVLHLTPQELQVARFVAGGRPTREVAAQLFLSPRTVEFHLRNVFLKLGISSRSELAALRLD
jgi:DNA-binding CsgD family transcriptional regulator